MWNEGPIPEELMRFPGYLMARLGQASSRRFAQALEPEGLLPRHFGVMNIVAAHPGISQQGLRDLTAIDASSMVSLIDELEALGVAERRPNPADRRARAIFLTSAGERKLKRLRRVAGDLQRDFFGNLSEAELVTLHGLLRKLAERERSD
ncbi:MAG: hypothetical protein NVS2B6_14960 [Thermoleophilaceae bacterium]